MKTTAMRISARRGASPRFPLMGDRDRRGDQVPARAGSIAAFSERIPVGLPGADGIEDQVIVALSIACLL